MGTKRPREEKAVVAPKVVDLKPFLDDVESSAARSACSEVATSLKETGIVILKDPRVSKDDSEGFLDTMEDYFAQPDHIKMADVHEELHYQVGATPSLVEIPICKTDDECIQRIEKLAEEDKPQKIVGPDPKWRFFWRIGEREKGTGFDELNAAPVVPAAFPHWEETMDGWGGKMLNSVTTCAEMAALGLGLEKDAISKMMQLGPHLLAPTGSDLGGTKWRKAGTTLAGFHNDLNLLTIHGKSRYPGLHAWLSDGTKIQVKVPDGCLLVQAGMQMEHLTGGVVEAGMHEVVVLPSTIEAAERQEAKGRPAWRISSTLFAHIASNQELRPLGSFCSEESLKRFPPTKAGDHVISVLKKINLAPTAMGG